MLAAVAAIFMFAASVQTTPVQAAAECKGLSKSACERRDDCVYVNSYTRKDKIKVDAYCRAKGGKGKKKTTKAKKTVKKKVKEKAKEKAEKKGKKPSKKARKKAKDKVKEKAKDKAKEKSEKKGKKTKPKKDKKDKKSN